MKYIYDTHLHVSEGSACAKSSAVEMVHAYKTLGYTGIFITDHFFNGNTSIKRELPWKERVELFCKGYEKAKAEGERIGLDVFFGFEYNVSGAEFLIYNLDKEWLFLHENIDIADAKTVLTQMRKDGGFVVQAHPFRERDYISHIKLFPDCIDAVEVLNGAHRMTPIFNERAMWYANSFDFPITAGSDSHSSEHIFNCGIETPERICSAKDYFDLVLKRKITVFEK